MSLHERAYAIMMLHASKYPSRPVTGILLGTKTHEAQLAKQQKIGIFSYDIVKAVPLSHHYVLAPMMEIAMTQIELHCKQEKLEIVGVYSGNERFDDNEVNLHTLKLGNKIKDHYSNPSILLLTPFEKTTPIRTFMSNSYNEWKQGDQYGVSGKADEVFQRAKEAGEVENVFDFDDHLENVKCDWLHQSAVKLA